MFSLAEVPATAQDWRASGGKTQLARYFAESLWRSPGVDVLAYLAHDGVVAWGADWLGGGRVEVAASRWSFIRLL